MTPTGIWCAVGPALVLGLTTAPAASADRAYTRCATVPGATVVAVARSTCTATRDVAAIVAASSDDGVAAALDAEGWTPYRALPDARRSYDVVALRGTAVLRVRRAGTAPDLDGFAAGRSLVLARPRLVAGRPIPDDAVLCTTGFTVRQRAGTLGGLSAAHCAGQRSDGTAQRRHAAQRRPPVPGIVLGRVQRLLSRAAPLDALVLPVPRGTGRTAVAVVDRGITRPPWIVAGAAAATAGRRTCFTGQTSGADRCGTLRGASARPLERFLRVQGGVVVRCTTVVAASGDSGGPVYTAPRADGTVRALGIATLVIRQSRRMCFTPIGPVLDRLRATLVTGAADQTGAGVVRRATSSRTTGATSVAKSSIDRRTSACSVAPTLVCMT